MNEECKARRVERRVIDGAKAGREFMVGDRGIREVRGGSSVVGDAKCSHYRPDSERCGGCSGRGSREIAIQFGSLRMAPQSHVVHVVKDKTEIF